MNENDDSNKVLGSFDIGLEEQIQLVTDFFAVYHKKDLTLHQAMALDLYRAINCYRFYGSVSSFLEINPELAACRDDIKDLWKEFEGLDNEELAEVSLKLLEEV